VSVRVARAGQDRAVEPPRRQRVRDPERGVKILDAAAELIGQAGFHAVSLGEIGTRAGITGSGIYRHFESKSAILVALFDRIVDALIVEQDEILRRSKPVDELLADLVRAQLEFVVHKREFARVYYSELHNLPAEDQVRLRRKQRLYLEEWVHLVNESRPELDDTEARVLVHAAIGALQSPLFHRVDVTGGRLSEFVVAGAMAVLRSDPRR
jgi:AcrR family transcriptional regulator